MSASEKLVFAEIHSLDNEFGCVAENQHFAEMFGLSERTVQHIIQSLKQKHLIEVVVRKANDTRVIRCLGSFARISDEQAAHLRHLRKDLSNHLRIGDDIRY